MRGRPRRRPTRRAEERTLPSPAGRYARPSGRESINIHGQPQAAKPRSREEATAKSTRTKKSWEMVDATTQTDSADNLTWGVLERNRRPSEHPWPDYRSRSIPGPRY
ncbi:hypothetical protein THAOC_07041 [Thalassiosira oceanica]|uniref:Uncharacterized protein n=1 Tax=Thalassiosira oceanica TaxID=159749 RepID=K0T2W4_THAOC|nr:hypothetical protein THAOC_07041 [Thalassiosira oceanica]|eukprot:EJK71509.1 hypothetical protein THAOC_07041 [Thalassiosira oceanica]